MPSCSVQSRSVGHALDDGGKPGQQHEHARIEVLLAQRLAQRLVGEVLALGDDAVGLDHLQREGRGDQHLGEQGVGIKRDRRDQLVELSLGQQLHLGERITSSATAGSSGDSESTSDSRSSAGSAAGWSWATVGGGSDAGDGDQRQHRHGILQLQHSRMPSGNLSTR